MGVLPSQKIRTLLRQGMFPSIDEKFVNPASLDIPFTAEVHRMSKLCKPREYEDVATLAREFGQIMRPNGPGESYVLENGTTYLVKVGKCYLPGDVYAYANPKSSTGRINVLVRVIADRVPKFDSLEPPGCQGDVWLFVQPRSFPIIIEPGTPLAQLRFLDGQAFAEQEVVKSISDSVGLFFSEDGKKLDFPHGQTRSHADKLHMTARISEEGAGWVCEGTNQPLDLRHTDNDWRDFFKSIEVRNGGIGLHPGQFYILTTKEHVRLPAELAAELRPVDSRVGEFRVHAAGFIDPGFGLETPNAITLEVTTSERSEYWLRDGEIIARIRFEMMADEPDVLYGVDSGSNYTKQSGARLAKFFRQNDD